MPFAFSLIGKLVWAPIKEKVLVTCWDCKANSRLPKREKGLKKGWLKVTLSHYTPFEASNSATGRLPKPACRCVLGNLEPNCAIWWFFWQWNWQKTQYKLAHFLQQVSGFLLVKNKAQIGKKFSRFLGPC